MHPLLKFPFKANNSQNISYKALLEFRGRPFLLLFIFRYGHLYAIYIIDMRAPAAQHREPRETQRGATKTDHTGFMTCSSSSAKLARRCNSNIEFNPIRLGTHHWRLNIHLFEHYCNEHLWAASIPAHTDQLLRSYLPYTALARLLLHNTEAMHSMVRRSLPFL